MTPTQYDTNELPHLGWIVITEIGEENVYFRMENGSIGFIKYDV